MSSLALDDVVPSPDDVAEITCAVWASFLSGEPGDDLLPSAPAPTAATAVTGCVHITGAWAGTVLVDCSPDLARLAAARLLALTPDELTDEDLTDAFGELVNMVGGNVKGILPGPSALSVPTVAAGHGALQFPGAVPVTEVDFVWHGEPLRVTVLRAPNRMTPRENSTP